MAVSLGNLGGGGGALWTEDNWIPLTIATMITSQLHLITDKIVPIWSPGVRRVRILSYLIWIVWYPADPDPIWSPGGGGGPLLSWGGGLSNVVRTHGGGGGLWTEGNWIPLTIATMIT